MVAMFDVVFCVASNDRDSLRGRTVGSICVTCRTK